MADPIFDLRQGEAGEFLTGTDGNVLTFVGGGRRVQGKPVAAPPAVFYQTVLDSTGAALAQEPALKFAAELVPSNVAGVATLVAAPGIATAQAAANAAQTTANLAVTAANAAQATATAASQPFKGTYYVDPSFVGTSTGSASSPFVTIAACWAAAVAQALPGAIVRIPPGVTVTENVVFPTTGGDWEIACDEAYGSSSAGARITGTVTANVTAGLGQFRLTRLVVNGAISCDVSLLNGTGVLALNRVRHSAGGITQTVSGGGTAVWVNVLIGDGVADENKQAGSDAAACVFAGPLLASNWTFDGTVSTAPNLAQFNAASIFQNCRFNVGGITNAGIAGSWHRFMGCTFGAATTMTTTNATSVQVDGASSGSLNSVGLTLAGAATTFSTAASNAGIEVTLANNLGATAFGGKNVEGQYEATRADVLLTTGGAGAVGLLQGSVTYTDMTGAAVTVAVGNTIDITAAAGTKAEGAVRFRHNGATAITYSWSGITNPGVGPAFAAAGSMAIRRCN